MRLTTAFSAATAAVLVVGTASPQGIPANEPWLQGSHMMVAIETMSRTEAIDFSGLKQTDILVRFQDRLLVAWRPECLHAFAEIASSIIDFDTLPGGGPGEADAVAYVNNTGLRIKWLNSTTYAFQTQLLENNEWNGARCVRSAYLDGSSTPSLIGISSDGSKLLRLDNPGTTNNLTTLTLPFGNAQIVEGLQWDNSTTASEFVYSRVGGLTVIDAAGVVQKDVAPYNTPPFAVVPEVGLGYDRVAAVVEMGPNAYQSLVTYDDVRTDAVTPLGTIEVQSVVAGDGEVNGHLGVLLSHRFNWQLFEFVNGHATGGAQSDAYTWANYDAHDLSAIAAPTETAPTNYGQSTFADIDNDGDADYCSPMQIDGGIGFKVNDTVDASLQRLSVASGSYNWDGNTNTGTLTIMVDQPSSWSGYDRLTASAWRQANYEAPPHPAAVADDVADDLTSWPVEITLELDEDPNNPSPGPDVGDPAGAIISIVLRLETDVGTVPYKASPTYQLAWSTEVDALAEYKLNRGYTDSTTVFPISYNGSAEGGVGDDGSGTTPIPVVDCMFDPDEIDGDVIPIPIKGGE